MNHDVTEGTGRTPVPFDDAPFSAVQDNRNFPSGMLNAAEQPQQPNNLHQSWSTSMTSSGNMGGGQRPMSEANHSHNGGYTTQQHRSLSPASFGSFSLDGEVMSESGGHFRDLNVHNDMTAPVADIHENASSQQQQHQQQQRIPQAVEARNENLMEYGNNLSENNQFEQRPQQQTLLTEAEKPVRLSPPKSTTNDGNMRRNEPTEENGKRSGNVRDVNYDQLKRDEIRLPAQTKTQNVYKSAENAPGKGSIENTGTETQDTRIPQPHENKRQQQQQQQQQQQKPLNDQVIELLEDDDVETDVKPLNHPQTAMATPGVKRPRPPETVVPGSSLAGYHSRTNQYGHNNNYRSPAFMIQTRDTSSEPQFLNPAPNHTPTWEHPLPPFQRQSQSHSNRYKHFELSLLNVSEFTITGLPVSFDGRPSSVLGFRKIIKEVSRGHGKAVFERDNPKNKNGRDDAPSTLSTEQYSSHGQDVNPDGGKWRIPLGAYRAFYSYLQSDRMCNVKGIPEDQLKIASLGKARLEKGFPSAQKVISFGVPKGLAMALAPFQRGGVEFVVEKDGRALIADDMGLGKTIQSIASMSVYHEEWPLLILTPSSARYHWAAEFNNWLGSGSSVNKENVSNDTPDNSTNKWDEPRIDEEENTTTLEYRKPMRLLKESEIHVMVAGKEKMFPSSETRIVVCSYGLATSLVESGKLHKGLFRCAIVDESHMLKNIKTKRTSKLVPILHATNRCILLSGTPALARPTELWPQLKILSTERDGWWDDENDFVKKYVQRTSAIRRAELHTMLTGTVMIRRLKHDILKSLKSKQREKAIVDVLTPETRREFKKCMELLREGKGVMAKLAKKHPAMTGKKEAKEMSQTEENKKKLESLKAEYNEICRQKLHNIRLAMQSVAMNNEEKENMIAAYFNQAKVEVDVWYKERVEELQEIPPKEEELDRKTILNKMYSMTAKAKIPLIAGLVGKWLDDPTKGKLCIFAHHIYVLDEIVKLVGLSNDQGSRKRFIRIDGSTSPKERQAQIVAFQNDPDIRIAVLGITAAGVAVTLTASSTVWFAELFWTPALMIQAEDRCHRIGQNAAVKCLYFVATGTLDVLLWDLLEKKFRDLGEFVEGKEKMKIVVKHTFKSIQELESSFERPGDDDLEDDAEQNENTPEAEGDDLVKLENDLQDDIVQLAQEEMVMISQDLGEDEDGTGPDTKRSGKQVSEENSAAQSKSGEGQTEDEAICLSDDEDDSSTHGNEVAKSNGKDNSSAGSSGGETKFDYSKARVLRNFRFYKQHFMGSSYGIQLLYIGHRLVVANNRFGNSKPTLGDVLVSVNGYALPFGSALDQVCQYMKNLIQKGKVELIFLEDEAFVKNCSSYIVQMMKNLEANKNQIRNKKPKNDPAKNSDDVIEILDDD